MTKTTTEARRSLMGMILCFPGAANESVELRAEAYFLALSDLTPDEICNVCGKASRGEIGNSKFVPSAAELHVAARPMAEPRIKLSPNWRPHQDRFLTSSGTLFVTEGGKTEVYTPEELQEFGYVLPSPTRVLNRTELEARGVKVLSRPSADDADPEGNEITRAIAASVKRIL